MTTPRPPRSTRPMQVSGPVYDKLSDLQAQLVLQRGRHVTYNEVLEALLERWEQTSEP